MACLLLVNRSWAMFGCRATTAAGVDVEVIVVMMAAMAEEEVDDDDEMIVK
jgi:hypothetical protein